MPGRNDPPKEHQFTSDNQPENRGRKKGSRGIASVLKEMLSGLEGNAEKKWQNPIAQKLIKIAFAPQSIKKKFRCEKCGHQNLIEIEIENIDQMRKALNDMLDRIEGKPTQTIESTSVDDVTITYADKGLSDA